MAGCERREMRSQELAEEAARWLVRLAAPDLEPGEAARFQAWLAKEPCRRQAFEEVQAIWGDLDLLAGMAAAGPGALEGVLGEEIEQCRRMAEELRIGRGRARRRRWLVAAVVLLGVVAGGWLVGVRPRGAGTEARGASHETRIGERRQVVLEDGSMVWLNTDTQVVVAFAGDKRRVHLVGGEAFFEVVPDPDRPFEVIADDEVVRAVGTAFNLHLRDHELRVAVVEGTVEVSSRVSSGPRRMVHAGQTATVGRGVARVERPPADRMRHTASWRQGRLHFDGLSLGELVAELDHYVPARIVVADESIASFEGGGVVDVDHVESILRALELAWPVQVAYESDELIILTRSSEPAQDRQTR